MSKGLRKGRFGKPAAEFLDLDVGDNAFAWRYFDIPKFLYLVTGRLFFTRSDLLGDHFEGAPPKAVYDIMHSQADLVGKIAAGRRGWKDPHKRVGNTFKMMRKATYVNCWHLNQIESAAMWSIYGVGAGLAVKSKVGSLRNIARDGIFLGKVKYVDHDSAEFRKGTTFYDLFFLKRKSFAFEQELRLIQMFDWPKTERKITPPGLEIPINLNELIEEIYVSPRFPNWYQVWIRAIMEKFGVKKSLIKSNLDSAPLA